MFSFASNKLRASKHGNFSSVDSWSSSERMFAKDGFNERWYQASECTYHAVVETNHPETQSNDNTDSKSAVYGRHVHQKSSNHLLFNNDCSHGPQRCPWPRCGFYYYSPLYRGNYSRLYWRFNLKNCFLLPNKIQNCPLLLVMLLFRNSINQSINQCSEPHSVA